VTRMKLGLAALVFITLFFDSAHSGSQERMSVDVLWQTPLGRGTVQTSRAVLERLLRNAGFVVSTPSDAAPHRVQVVVTSANALPGHYSSHGTCYSGVEVSGVVRVFKAAGAPAEYQFSTFINPPSIVSVYDCPDSAEKAPFHLALREEEVLAHIGRGLAAQFGSDTAFRYWASALRDKDVRFEAIAAIKVSRDPALVPLIVDQLVPGTAAELAKNALAVFGEKAVPELIRGLDRCRPEYEMGCKPERTVCCVRTSVVEALERITSQRFGLDKHKWLDWARGRGLLTETP